VEEHQRLACEIANLQTRKAILTAPIDRSGGVMEPSQEELLAQQQDQSGGADPLGHAHMVAEHARIQLREGGTVNSPRAGDGPARRDDEGDSEGDDEMGAEGARSTQDDGSTVALLMKMRANTSTGGTPFHALGSRSNAGNAGCGASPNDPTPPTVSRRGQSGAPSQCPWPECRPLAVPELGSRMDAASRARLVALAGPSPSPRARARAPEPPIPSPIPSPSPSPSPSPNPNPNPNHPNLQVSATSCGERIYVLDEREGRACHSC